MEVTDETDRDATGDFEEVYFGWNESRLTQEEAARILGVCDRTFRRYIDRYDHEGMEGLSDRHLTQASFRRAPVDSGDSGIFSGGKGT